MSTEAAFLAAILADPDDDAPRLIYSDWLDQQGRGERAEFIRVQCTLAEMGDDGLPVAHDRGNCCCDLCRLRRRERELCTSASMWEADRANHAAVPIEWPPPIAWRRGFVHSLALSAAYWLTHAAAILAAQPIEQVTFSVMPTDDELIEMDAAVRAYRDGTPSVWTMRRWPRIKKWTLPQAEPIHGRIVQIPDDVGSPESVARSLVAMRQAGERLAMEREEAILRAMGIPIDRDR